MKTRYFLALWLLLALGTISGGQIARAEGEESTGIFTKFTDTFDGYLKQETAVRADELDQFVKIKNTLELGYSRKFGEHVKVTLKGDAWYDAAYDVEDDLDVVDEHEYRAAADLREAFLDLSFGPVDMRLGKQQVVWGKTDEFRVVDIVNPLDYRELILNELIDRRIPLWIASVNYYFTTDFSVQFLMIPDMHFTKLANRGSEYALKMPAIPASLLPIIHDEEKPEESFKHTEYGASFTGYYNGWDFTLNYLYTWDDDPTVKKSVNLQNRTLTVFQEHERMNVIGATFANVFWDTVVRGEIAANLGRYFAVNDMKVADMVVEKDQLSYALAFERKIADISWLLQFLQETILDYDKAITDDRQDTKITLRASKMFKNDTLEFVLSTIYGANDGEFLIRPSVKYAINDALSIKGGTDFFEGGNEDSLFGQFDDKDRIYVELKYSF